MIATAVDTSTLDRPSGGGEAIDDKLLTEISVRLCGEGPGRLEEAPIDAGWRPVGQMRGGGFGGGSAHIRVGPGGKEGGRRPATATAVLTTLVALAARLVLRASRLAAVVPGGLRLVMLTGGRLRLFGRGVRSRQQHERQHRERAPPPGADASSGAVVEKVHARVYSNSEQSGEG